MRKLNNKGSALAWVMMMIVVFAIFGTAALSMSGKMFHRSLGNHQEQQAYLTAKSAIDTIALQFKMNRTFAKEVKMELDANGTIAIEEIGFVEDMGACSVFLSSYGETEIKVTATAKVFDAERTVSGILYPYKEYGHGFPSAPILGQLTTEEKGDLMMPVGTQDDYAVYELNTSSNHWDGSVNIVTTGISDIFIYVRAGCELKISGVTGVGSGDLFIILEDGATLTVNPNNQSRTMSMFIFGPNATFNCGNNTHLVGNFVAGEFNNDKSFELTKTDPVNPDYDLETAGEGEGIVLYDISKYLDEG